MTTVYYELRAQDIMQTEIVTILSDLSVADAALLMKREGIRSLLVEKDDPGDAYGIITYTDIVSKVLSYGLDPAEITVAEVMTKPLVVVNPTLSVRHIAALFQRTGIGHAPVISNHQLVGMVSKTDLIVEVIGNPTLD